MATELESEIVEICNYVYKTLGTSHNECVYQKALAIELHHNGFSIVETEKNVPVFFTDTKGFTHTIGTERIDIFAIKNNMSVVLELKATTGTIRNNVELQQLKKYQFALDKLNIKSDILLVINFKQNVNDISNVDYMKLVH
jgi:GxxExxY protein